MDLRRVYHSLGFLTSLIIAHERIVCPRHITLSLPRVSGWQGRPGGIERTSLSPFFSDALALLSGIAVPFGELRFALAVCNRNRLAAQAPTLLCLCCHLRPFHPVCLHFSLRLCFRLCFHPFLHLCPPPRLLPCSHPVFLLPLETCLRTLRLLLPWMVLLRPLSTLQQELLRVPPLCDRGHDRGLTLLALVAIASQQPGQ